MSRVLPTITEWMELYDKQTLLMKIMRAESVVGQHGTITIQYFDGKAVKVTAETSIKKNV